MTEAGLPGLGPLLGYLGSVPGPDDVVAAIAEGPLAQLDVVSVLLYVLDGARGASDALVLVGQQGVDPAWVDTMRIVPTPAGVGALITPPAQSIAAMFDAWEHTFVVPHAGLREASVAHPTRATVTVVPVTQGGEPVGLLVAATQRPWVPDPVGADVIGAALGLWRAHPDSGVDAAIAELRQLARPALTDRQVEVLRLVEAGWSTEHIAAGLHLAASTVKADIHLALQVLGVDDRREAARRARELGAFGE